ncbi:unnamed protein product [Caenorhabditis auriculariae]|uniref:Uncharacterized protein n=1 Tax=Caenorhabditis auriculariae TaxID=2777116 RepID=A0A8S1H2Q8_9PELO|nr:unnamed protein product [Caenorhabditis auriculariae]
MCIHRSWFSDDITSVMNGKIRMLNVLMALVVPIGFLIPLCSKKKTSRKTTNDSERTDSIEEAKLSNSDREKGPLEVSCPEKSADEYTGKVPSRKYNNQSRDPRQILSKKKKKNRKRRKRKARFRPCPLHDVDQDITWTPSPPFTGRASSPPKCLGRRRCRKAHGKSKKGFKDKTSSNEKPNSKEKISKNEKRARKKPGCSTTTTNKSDENPYANLELHGSEVNIPHRTLSLEKPTLKVNDAYDYL